MKQFVGSETILSERTYRKAESDLVATEKTLRAIDQLFSEAKAKKTGSRNPKLSEIGAIDRWLELRRENPDLSPATDEDPVVDEETRREPEGTPGGELSLPPAPVESPQDEPLVLPAKGRLGVKSRLGWAFMATTTVAVLVLVKYFTDRHSKPEETVFVPSSRALVETGSPQKKSGNSTPKKQDTPPKVAPRIPTKIESSVAGPPRPATAINRAIPKLVVKPAGNKRDLEAPAKPPVHETVPYEAEFVSSGPFKARGFPIVECEPGELHEFRISVKNIGSEPWTRKHRPFSLGVLPSLQPTDKDRVGHGPVTVEWMSATGPTENPDLNRVFLNWDEVVGPGETKIFQFKLRVPREPGTYPVTLQMVMDGPDIAASPSNDGWFAGQTVHVIFKVKDID